METLALIFLIIFSIIGFGAIFFTTFGTLIILIGACLYAFLTGFYVIDFGTLIVIVILYLLGEISEYLCIIVGAKKMGESGPAVMGALAGGICGALSGALFLGVGFVLSTFLGIFLGAFLVELFIQRDFIKSLKAGTGGY